MIRLGVTSGGHTKDPKQKEEEFITDTTVQFRQIINGVPTVNHDEGIVRVTIDNDGTITNMHRSVKKVTGLSVFPKSIPLDPKKDSNLESQAANTKQSIEKAFDEKISNYKTARLIEGSEETGYDVANKYGRLVVQRVYEVTFEKDFKKLIEVTVPVFE